MTLYRQCHIFQTFIRDCYDNNMKTFIFGSNRDIHLYFGLEDIYALSGIPVDGDPVICNDIPTEELCMKMLGSYELFAKKKMQVSKAWLRQSFEAVPVYLTEKTLIYHVWAYLLYLIGTRILPNSDNSLYFPTYWLQFLEDVSDCGLNSVAWGTAAHCLLTSTITSNNGTGFLGPSWLYEDIVWTPYCDYPSYRAQRIFFSCSVLINFDKIQYHEPEKGPKQLSITDLEEVGEQEALKPRMSRGTTQRNYCKRYENVYILCRIYRKQDDPDTPSSSPSLVHPYPSLVHPSTSPSHGVNTSPRKWEKKFINKFFFVFDLENGYSWKKRTLLDLLKKENEAFWS
ncbi:hypothetical protein R6Q57_004344 [Mikania cordata]